MSLGCRSVGRVLVPHAQGSGFTPHRPGGLLQGYILNSPEVGETDQFKIIFRSTESPRPAWAKDMVRKEEEGRGKEGKKNEMSETLERSKHK